MACLFFALLYKEEMNETENEKVYGRLLSPAHGLYHAV